MSSPGPPAERWSAALAEWAIPEDIKASAPESPYFFDPVVFTAAADDAAARSSDSPSDRAARAALAQGGIVLDVGVGAGAASLRLADRAGAIIGVDTNTELLAVFESRARSASVATETVVGPWPEVAGRTPLADIVVCHHVFYNVPDLAAFVEALCAHARSRVVVELTAVHPLAWMAPYWEALHGWTQPTRPTADTAVEVLEDLGLNVHQERWSRPLQMIGESDQEALGKIARRLCLPSDRHAELRRVLEEVPPPSMRNVVTLWWEGPARD